MDRRGHHSIHARAPSGTTRGVRAADLLVRGLNATALLVIAPAPVAVIVDAAWRRRVSIRSALVTTGILGATTVVMSAWWLAGLVTQGRHGSAVLSYTEALPSTAATSTAPEVLRGLGYWLFYDRNEVVPLTSAATPIRPIRS